MPGGDDHLATTNVKLFFGYSQCDSATTILAETGFLSFRTVVHNCKISFLNCRICSTNNHVAVL